MRHFLLGLLLLVAGFGWAPLALAQDEPIDSQEYARGKVIEVMEDHPGSAAPFDDASQVVLVEILSGEDEGQAITVTYTFSSASYRDQRLAKGSRVVMAEVIDARGSNYYILDSYRLPTILIYVVIFALTAIAFGRMRGAGSLLGLSVSLLILMLFVVPRIIAGDSPILISFIGSCAIAVTSILLAHGFNRRSYVALVATLVALVAAFALALLAVGFASLAGTGTEEAVFLQLSYLPTLDLRGLLLGGIILGSLGVLDDVTTAQVAAVDEISRANTSLGAMELYKRGISVGRDHIAALVNTLVLAYAGASFPLFLLFALPEHPPLWIILNNENIVEEVLRALVGGTALMLAVPIATAFAAAVFGSLARPASATPTKRLAHHH
ncbi:MAG: YibE/F family protein [Patescibacteria group bacterium]